MSDCGIQSIDCLKEQVFLILLSISFLVVVVGEKKEKKETQQAQQQQ